VTQGRKCLILTSRGPIVNRAWGDPERGYVPLRVESFVNGRLSVLLTVNYRTDAVVGWVPETWQATMYSGRQTTRESSDNRLLQVEFNREYPLETFQIAFPPGTQVIDNRMGTQRLIADDSGRLVPIDAAGRSGMPATLTWLLAMACVLLGAGLIAVWLRSRSQTH
jgi:hypothetical protein